MPTGMKGQVDRFNNAMRERTVSHHEGWSAGVVIIHKPNT